MSSRAIGEKKIVRIWSVARAYTRASLRYPIMAALIIISVVGMQAGNVIGPLYLRDFINTISSNPPSAALLAGLFGILTIYGVILIGGWIARRIEMVSQQYLEVHVMENLAVDAFEYLLKHSYDFFTSNFTGTLTRRVTRYSRAYEQVLDSVTESFLPAFLFAIGSIVVLYSRNHWLGLGLLLWIVVFIVAQVILTRWRHPLRVARAAEDSRMTGVLSDAIGNQSAITLFAAEAYENTYFRSVVASWRQATTRSWSADAWIQAIQHALALTVEIGLLVLAVFLWRDGLLTVGDFVLIQVYILGLIDQLWNVGNTLRRVYDAFADASEMVDILETPHAVQDRSHAKQLQIESGKITFQNVSFYFGTERPVLDNFSLEIRGGEKVALVGPSGAGKSTVTKLLLRLYDPRTGSIEIDGQDIREVTQESLRNFISFVPQEPVLFHRTLRENISYGRRDATLDEIISAAKRSHCHEFISRLPAGYETYVGERGIKLSGGERQRVAIARAILKNAPILVLDEATSSLDSESESLIQEAFLELMKDKTVIAIAHRLSTIMRMDRIIVMENGKAILSGSHDELLAQDSNLYKKLWEIQAGGFINKDE